MARLAFALKKLREQVNDAAPKRSKESDGWIGDTKHSARKSDHNPNKKGVVCALDITHDPDGGFDSYEFAEHLRQERDERIANIISNGRIFSSTVSPWKWRKYTGANKHAHHVHISVAQDPSKYDDESAWDIGVKPPPDIEEPEEEAPKKTGITETSAVGGAASGGDAIYQVFDAASSAPKSVWESLINAVQQPRFLIAVAICGICIYIFLQRRKQKNA